MQKQIKQNIQLWSHQTVELFHKQNYSPYY